MAKGKETKKEIKIVNIVVSTGLEKDIPLEKMAATLPNTEYNPEQFPGLVLRIKEPKTSALIFSSGKIVLTGARTMEDVQKGIEAIIKQLKKLNINVTIKPEITVQNIVASGNVGMDLNLNVLGLKLHNTEYEPEQFPGLVHKLKGTNATFLLFSNGKIVCTGTKTEQEVDEQIKTFRDFIEQNYYPQLLEAVRKGESFIKLDFSELVKFNTEISEELLENPQELLKAGEIAVKEFDLPKKVSKFNIRFLNLPESQKVLISEIRSKHLNKLLWVDGIVRNKTDVRPHVSASKFECPSCGNILTVLQLDQKYKEPTRCGCGRKGKFKEISKELVDGQGLVLEESPDDLDGSQPKRLNVFLKDDLVSPITEKRSSPGSRVKIHGWVIEVPISLRTGGRATKYDLVIEANYVEPLEEDFLDAQITDAELEQIRTIAKLPNALHHLAKSIAPSIYGHDKIKEALVLQLAGGCRKMRPDGVSTRGDMHILLIGDPGSGKSQLLKRISKIAPKARFASGKGATGAGLTASVVKDEFLGGWSLEAGTLVLANQGFAIIDELDKMGKEDRSALHEALEQQTISVAKANIQATLRCETTVLSAANPKFGRFDPYDLIANQINLPPTLINRFDLIFPVK